MTMRVHLTAAGGLVGATVAAHTSENSYQQYVPKHAKSARERMRKKKKTITALHGKFRKGRR